MTKDEALRMALEALTATMSTHGFKDAIDEAQDKAITAIKEALANHIPDATKMVAQPEPVCGFCDGTGEVDSGGTQPWGESINIRCRCTYPEPEQEPVAWYHAEDYKTHFTTVPSKDLIKNGYWQPLYTTPPQRKPLTDEQRNWIVATCPTPRHIIDTVEKMHGIKE